MQQPPTLQLARELIQGPYWTFAACADKAAELGGRLPTVAELQAAGVMDIAPSSWVPVSAPVAWAQVGVQSQDGMYTTSAAVPLAPLPRRSFFVALAPAAFAAWEAERDEAYSAEDDEACARTFLEITCTTWAEFKSRMERAPADDHVFSLSSNAAETAAAALAAQAFASAAAAAATAVTAAAAAAAAAEAAEAAEAEAVVAAAAAAAAADAEAEADAASAAAAAEAEAEAASAAAAAAAVEAETETAQVGMEEEGQEEKEGEETSSSSSSSSSTSSSSSSSKSKSASKRKRQGPLALREGLSGGLLNTPLQPSQGGSKKQAQVAVHDDGGASAAPEPPSAPVAPRRLHS